MIKNNLYDLYNVDIRSDTNRYFKFLNEREINFLEEEVVPSWFTSDFKIEKLENENKLKKLDEKKYTKIFYKQEDFLKKLKNSKIDIKVLKYFLNNEENLSVKDSINSFYPEKNGFAKKVIYNRFNTKTGRLTVKCGPKILNLPSKYRSIITSRFGVEGSIVELDFKSVEPRIFKKVLKEEVPEDIYSHIQSIIDEPVDASVIKKTIISVLYGASSLGQNTNISFSTWEKVNRAVLEYFDLKKMLKISSEVKNERRYNYYGRPINNLESSDNVIINNYIQSTAADFFLIAFDNILNQIESENCVPLFVLHDAFILDVHNDELNKVQNYIKQGYNDKELGNFPIGIKKY
jgi:DNA polymerase I-like protein with 3'-5' exonuclease and polymerase domains